MDALAPDEGVVSGDGAVGVQPQELAGMVAGVLRPRRLGAPVPDAHQQRAVRQPGDPRTIMPPGLRAAILGEQFLDIDQAVTIEPRAPKRRGRSLGDSLRVREVDPAVLRVVGVEGDVEQAALAMRGDLRQAGDAGDRAVASDQVQPSRPLSDQVAAVREERDAPRILQPPGDPQHANLLVLGGDALRHDLGRVSPLRGQPERKRGRRDDIRSRLSQCPVAPCSSSTPGPAPLRLGPGGIVVRTASTLRSSARHISDR
jgi:hypothetical protein